MNQGIRRLTSPEAPSAARRAITQWQAGGGSEPSRDIACPLCGAAGLSVIDRSARPHSEWYALNCTACGLDEAIAIPLGAAIPRHD